jgi:hypothetical protein
LAKERSPKKAEPRALDASVENYKAILRRVLDNRPSGTRQRLAHALGKNRSFISLISNPIYPVPVPAQHLETIFAVCHFSAGERKQFLEAYTQAHRTQMRLVTARRTMRSLSMKVPDLGSAERNRVLDDLIEDFVRSAARHLEQL